MGSRIQLDEHFGYGKLLRFTAPSIAMMVFTSVYGVVDGFFISNFTGKTPFAAVNIIWPYVTLFGIVGFIFGTGGSAFVACALGQGDNERANSNFSLFTILTAAVGVVLMLVGLTFLKPVAALLGADGPLLGMCVQYGRILLMGTPFLVLQYLFSPFLITAERPRLNLCVTLVAGFTNMVLDLLFVGLFHWGLTGAGWASVIGQAVGGLAPLFFFARKDNGSPLTFCRTHWDGDAVRKSCLNGMSEFVNNVSLSFVSMLYNWRLLRFAGEDGVDAFGVIMYMGFIFIAIYFGYVMGVSPVVSFHYGAGHCEEMRNLRQRSMRLLLVAASVLTLVCLLLSRQIAAVFVSYDPALLSMTTHGLQLYGISFLLAPFNIFASSFFTALNNGVVSAIISFLRLLLFQCLALLLLPLWLGLDGVWLAMPVAEAASFVVSVFFLLLLRKRYGY